MLKTTLKLKRPTGIRSGQNPVPCILKIIATIFRCQCFFFSLVLLFPLNAWGEGPESRPGNIEFPWHITADELIYDETNEVYIASGNVVITKMDKKITAETIRFDHKKMTAMASGHVVMSVGRDLIHADALEIDLKTEKGTVQNGSFFLYKENFYISGTKILKTGENSYYADKASITTCDGEKPAWKITGRNLNVTIEGYGYARHATLWVKNIPVLYTPFIAFPVKTRRQTGLLVPQLGVSSRKGFEYNQPFFWAINQSMDATFYDYYMAERGNRFGTEFRYVLSPFSKGTLMVDYLEDKRVDDGTGDNSENWGYDDTLNDDNDFSEDILRPDKERYWFRMKHDQKLPSDFFMKLDLDIASDQDYLQEFKDGYSGYRFTKDYYNEKFSRDIDDYNDPIRLNRLNISRKWSSLNLNTEFRWYDDVISRQQEETDTTVQRLPFIQLNAPKQPLLQSPFYGSMTNEYTHFYRQNADTANSVTRDHRLDLHPRIYLPLHLKYYATLEPSVGVRGTYWQIAAYENQPEDMEDHETFFRDLYDFKLDLSTRIYRIFHTSGNDVDRVKHELTPRIVYTYIPEKDQEDYPNFDGIDRIEKENEITYSLTNLFTYRSKVEKKRFPGEETAELRFKYQQFCRLYVAQSYDINEAQENEPSEWKNGETQEPFSPVYGLVEFTPEKFFSLRTDAEWSPYEEEFLSHHIGAEISDSRGDRLFFEHRYQEERPEDELEDLESVRASLLLRLSEKLSTIAEYEKDIYEDEEILSSLGMHYESQCWSIQIKYTKDIEEEKYSLMVNLHGLGEAKSNL